jgi:hypothetical protein
MLNCYLTTLRSVWFFSCLWLDHFTDIDSKITTFKQAFLANNSSLNNY